MRYVQGYDVYGLKKSFTSNKLVEGVNCGRSFSYEKNDVFSPFFVLEDRLHTLSHVHFGVFRWHLGACECWQLRNIPCVKPSLDIQLFRKALIHGLIF